MGAVNGVGQSSTPASEDQDNYEIIGNNCIDNNLTYNLCSYKTTNKYVIYDRESDNNQLHLNETSINTYIKNTSSIAFGITVTTNLPLEQRLRGNYGITYEIAFANASTDETIIKNYTLDINQFEGNPYTFTNPKHQLVIFDIDGVNFKYINKVYLFCIDFPNQDNSKPNDIAINGLEMYGSQVLNPADLESYSLSLITPQGSYFDENSSPDATKLIQAQVRVKGKYINPETQILPYYWFIENNNVTTSSEEYNSYGGQGWACLNTKTTQWIAGDYQYTIHKSDSAAKETKYKCVVIYNDVVLSKVFTIFNYSSEYDISIISDSGTQFYYDIGNPSLTCLVNGREENGYTYKWVAIDNNNNFTSLLETIAYNIEYNTAKSNYNRLIEEIAEEESMAAASQAELQQNLTIIDKYDKIMRVENKNIYHIQISDITNFTTYKCSVYHNNIYIGTASITLYNNLNKESGYTLVINNSSQLFKYSKTGVSPASKSLENPQVIPNLSFTIYDDLGNAISDDILENCQIEWMIPYENTLLDIPSEYQLEESADGYIIIKNQVEIKYQIKDTYNIDSINNDIRLKVKYEDINLIAATDFVFSKEGDLGINGNDFVCKIVPNTQNINFGYPMILNGQLNYIPKETNKWFNVQLWHDGIKIFEGNIAGTSTENKNVSIKWSILKNKYNNTVFDNSSLSVTDNGIFSYLGYNGENSPANIIRAEVEYDNEKYYATMPMITAETAQDYKISLREGYGFRFALYNKEGALPQYDNSNPFTLDVMKIINGVWENVSTLTKDHAVTYSWNVKGRIYNVENYNTWINNQSLLEYKTTDGTLLKNQKWYRPSDEYNGYCVNNALECIVWNKDNQQVAKIHIPIHFLLNKKDNVELDTWDGNYINLNGNEKMLIPQIGTGKISNDTFTGVFFGKIKSSNQNQLKSGLFGYNTGNQMFSINSENNAITIGRNNNAQIIMNNTGAIELKNTGISINLTNKTISWVNGNFAVDENGYITAKAGGSIANFNIGNYTLSKNTVGLSSNSNYGYAFWAGDADYNQAPFYIDHTGKIYATKGTIGGWTIDTGEIKNSSGTVHFSSSGYLRGPNWSINSNGHAIFKDIEISSANSSLSATDKILNIGSFYVYKNGYTYIDSGYVNGSVVSTGINATNITTGNLNISSGNCYFRMGFGGNANPSVSGLNVGTYGIDMNGSSVRECSEISNSNGDIIIKGGTSESHIKVYTASDGAVTLKDFIQGVIDGTY